MSLARRMKRQAKPAMDQLNRSLQKLQQLGGLQKGVEDIEEFGRVVTETHRLVNALVDDYQALQGEVELQREVFLRLLITLSGDPEEDIRKVEGALREQLLKEREGK